MYNSSDNSIFGQTVVTLKEKAHKIIDTISEKTLAKVISFLEYVKIKEKIEATNEILDDNKLFEAVQAGLEQYEKNDLVEIDEIKDV